MYVGVCSGSRERDSKSAPEPYHAVGMMEKEFKD